MSTNKRKSSLEDFQLFYEELVFTTKRSKSTNRIQRARVAAATK